MPDVVLDVQAIQSRAHGERGIARYTRELALAVDRAAPDLIDAFVCNPQLPMPSALDPLGATGRLYRSDHPAIGEGAAVYHVGSPFESVPMSQLLPPAIVTRTTRLVTTLYDLIPLRYPEVYLHDRTNATAYRKRIPLLAASDRVVCISDATALDAVELGGVPSPRATAIYGGAGADFVPAPDPAVPRDLVQSQLGISGPYALVPSGIEWRKNLNRLFEAFATLPAAIRALQPLVVQCQITEGQRVDLTRQLEQLGIADVVHFTGFVTDELLVALYQAADLVVFPSLYEGLGLPVLEARRCGTPVICSDSSSLSEIIPLAAARFDPCSAESIAATLERSVTNTEFAAELRDVEVPARFSWDAAGARFAEILSTERERGRRRRRTSKERRLKLAIVSPAPPTQCGPSMYLGEMLASLAERCDITLFVASDPEQVRTDAPITVERLSLLEQTERLLGPFDEVLYSMGNSEYHLFFPEFLRRRPGVVLLHDARFHGLYAEMARLRPDLLPEGFHGALHRMYPGRYPVETGRDGWLNAETVERLGITMIADIARRATRIFAHSEHAADLVELDCGQRPEVLFPLPVPSRARGTSADAGLVGSFGIVAATKAPDLIIEAIALDPDLRLVLVGPIGDGDRGALVELAHRLGCNDRLTITGEVSDDEYQSWLERVGVFVQLRRTSNGESSAAVCDALGIGTPLVVNARGALAELPPEVAVVLPTDPSPAELSAVLAGLASDQRARAKMLETQRRYRADHSYDAAAGLLVEALSRGR